MLWRTHLLFGLVCGIFLQKYLGVQNLYAYYGLVLFGSLLPDIDHPKSFLGRRIWPISKIISFFSKHRGILHSLLFGIIICLLMFKFFNPGYGIALFIGFFSHLLSDAFSKEGINFLYPIAKLRLSGFIEVGSSGETLFEVMCAIIIIALLL